MLKDKIEELNQPFFQNTRDLSHLPLIRFGSLFLLKLEKSPGRYIHLLKKKDQEHVNPIANYFIGECCRDVYLGGDFVKNLCIGGRRKYRELSILVILTPPDIEKYANILNNIICANDGAFSMGFKYRVRKNRKDGCFKNLALARYTLEPRLEGLEKLLYPLRASSIELDLTTEQAFCEAAVRS